MSHEALIFELRVDELRVKINLQAGFYLFTSSEAIQMIPEIIPIIPNTVAMFSR